jgi:hypothetical protein
MAPELRDWHEYLKRHPVQTQAVMAPERIADLTAKSQSVVAHPGWQLFLDRLATRRESLTKQRDRLQSEMNYGPALGQDLERLKMQMQVVTGEMSGVEFAASIIPEMLEAGEKMLQSLTGAPSEPATR